MTVTWQDIAGVVEARGGRPAWRHGSERGWRIPSPTGGTFTAEVTLRPRWCSITVDRWRTTDRDETRSRPWFEQHAHPLVDQAFSQWFELWSAGDVGGLAAVAGEALQARRRGWGTLPSGHTFSSASPVQQADVPQLLAAWIDAELTWGIAADDQWPEFAPHRVIPGPQGEYG